MASGENGPPAKSLCPGTRGKAGGLPHVFVGKMTCQNMSNKIQQLNISNPLECGVANSRGICCFDD